MEVRGLRRKCRKEEDGKIRICCSLLSVLRNVGRKVGPDGKNRIAKRKKLNPFRGAPRHQN